MDRHSGKSWPPIKPAKRWNSKIPFRGSGKTSLRCYPHRCVGQRSSISEWHATFTSMLTILCRYYLLRWDCDPDVKGLKDNKDLKIAVLKSDLYKVTNFALSLSIYIYIYTYMRIYVHSSDHYDSGSWCRPSPWLWKFPSTPLSSIPSSRLATGNHY